LGKGKEEKNPKIAIIQIIMMILPKYGDWTNLNEVEKEKSKNQRENKRMATMMMLIIKMRKNKKKNRYQEQKGEEDHQVAEIKIQRIKKKKI